MKRFLTILLYVVFCLPTILFAHGDDKSFNCFTIIAGKDATVDGSVIMGHNEDNWKEQMLSMNIVPFRNYKPSEMLTVEANASIPQESSSARYIWVEMMAQSTADVYLNQYGVALVSNQCGSREDREDYTDGGITYSLRRAVAERATSARNAVDIIGKLVEKYGYSSSGRTYCVADDKEGWIVSVVQGRRWVAQRISDDKVMVIPNYYIIDEIDLGDIDNFRASVDIITYAEQRGWYNPNEDGAFSFKKAYSNPEIATNQNNISRQWGALRFLSKTPYELASQFPFEVEPKQKIDIEMVTEVLSDHYENTPLDRVKSTDPGEPHSGKWTICNAGTQSSVIFQLRNLPANIGSIMWTAMFSPCRQVYVPWYLGTDYFPHGYAAIADPIEARDNHFLVKENFRENFPNAKYWKFVDYSKYIGENYVERMEIYTPRLEKLQKKIYKSHKKFDKNTRDTYKFLKLRGSPNADDYISGIVGEYSRKYHKKMMKIVKSRK